jgi:hypothetical protein
MKKGASRIHLPALAADAFDVPAAFPFLGNAFAHAERVAFDVSLVVVNDRLPVNDFDLHQLSGVGSSRITFGALLRFNRSGGHDVGNPLTRFTAAGRGDASASLVSAIYW